jgi:hypothetical protein
MKPINKRFGSPGPIRLVEKELKTNLGKGNFIFVGSATDMFAEDVFRPDILAVINHCLKFPDNKYLFQSKNTSGLASFDCRFPDNSITCTTLETNREYYPTMGNSPTPANRVLYFSNIKKEKHVTIEPIMDFDFHQFVDMIKWSAPAQVNIGADSGRNGLPEPPTEKVLELIAELEKFTKVVRKPNLERLIKNGNKELHAANAPLLDKVYTDKFGGLK